MIWNGDLVFETWYYGSFWRYDNCKINYLTKLRKSHWPKVLWHYYPRDVWTNLSKLIITLCNKYFFFPTNFSVKLMLIISQIYTLLIACFYSGLSFKTQCITAVAYGGKTFCIFHDGMDNIIGFPHLAAFLATCWVIYMMMRKLKSTYNRELDNFPLLYLVFQLILWYFFYNSTLIIA